MPFSLLARPRLVAPLLLAAALTAANPPAPLSAEPPDEDEPPTAERMTNQRLGELLRGRFETVEGRDGFWIIPIPPAKPAPEAEPPDEDDRDPFDDRDQAANGKPKLEDGETAAVLMVVTDERADRMRIMTPIQKFDAENPADRKLSAMLLAANFDRALDAKYAVNNGVLWSCFVHPLGSLTEGGLDGALKAGRHAARQHWHDLQQHGSDLRRRPCRGGGTGRTPGNVGSDSPHPEREPRAPFIRAC